MKNTLGELFLPFLLCLLFFSGAVSAQPWQLEVKTGAFVPQSRRIADIFNRVMPFVEVESSYRYSGSFGFWGSAGIIFDQGRSLGCNDRTTIQVYPLGLGVNYIFSVSSGIESFVGLGGIWGIYRNKDYSPYVHQNIATDNFGGIIKAGFNFQVGNQVAIALFGEYMYLKFGFHKVYEDHFTYRHNVNMSGAKLGIGLLHDF